MADNNSICAFFRDCWCVAFGNSYNDEERCVLAGYDNGDIKMFDLRFNKVRHKIYFIYKVRSVNTQ